MKKIMIVLGMAILVGLLGCGKTEKDYIGTYVNEGLPHESIKKRVLTIKIIPGQIRPNYIWEYRTEHKEPWMFDGYSSGTWKISWGKIVFHAGGIMYPPPTLDAELKGNKLLDYTNNRVYVKQD